MLYVIIDTGQKICGQNFRQQDQVTNLAKLSSYMVCTKFDIHVHVHENSSSTTILSLQKQS